MKTSVTVEMGIYDFTAKPDLQRVECSSEQPFACLDYFWGEALVPEKLATLEPERFVLDGSMRVFPNDLSEVEFGLWSGLLSDGDCNFAQPVVLRFVFSEPHECIGLTFYFEAPTGEAAGWMQVRWLDASGAEVARHRAKPTSATWFLKKRVAGFVQIVVEFLGTSLPKRYLKLNGIEFGTRKLFGTDEILQATVLEELDPTGSELRIGRLELEVLTKDAEFSILNPDGVYYGLRQRQELQVFGEKDGRRFDFGSYFLSEWTGESENTASFVATDLVGVLDRVPFEGGIFDTSAAGFAWLLFGDEFKYWLEETLLWLPVQGWLPSGTKREALQQFAFAIGAVVDTSRDGIIKLYPAPERTSFYVSFNRKFNGSGGVALRPYISGVQVAGHRFVADAARESVFSAALARGEHTISMEKPCHSYAAQGAQVLEQHPNHVRLWVEQGGQVEVTAASYRDTVFALGATNRSFSSDDESLLQVDAATLTTPELAQAAAQRLVDYHSRRYKYNFRMRLGDERLGDSIIVSSFKREKLKGVVESMEIDLAKGFLVDVVVCGQRLDSRWIYFAGELPSGGEGVL